VFTIIEPENIPFQVCRPVFVKRPLLSFDRQLNKGDEFRWKEIGVSEDKALILYTQGFILCWT